MLRPINKRLRTSYPRLIALGMAVIILAGTVILTLPVATSDGRGMSFVDALFTATSATCVTGLVVADTYQNWSLFGQVVILALIQIGGLGFITIAVFIGVVFRRRIGIKGREAINESINTIQSSGAVRLTKEIVKGSFIIEIIGAVLLSIRFVPRFGIARGIYMGIFHSISAFCNAGFDVMGISGEYISLTEYSGDMIVNVTICALIIVGGIGFIVWDDILHSGWHFKRYMLHTKIVILSTVGLVLLGTLLIYVFEMNASFEDRSLYERVLCSIFSSVTARTAGFNTVDTAALSVPSKLVTMALMFIGGSPGSTAGGIKTTTLVVMLFSALGMIRGTQHTNIMGRRLDKDLVKKASTIFMVNLMLAIVATIIITATGKYEMGEVLFESFSAVGTVGMSEGITRSLNGTAKIVIITLMYIGRVGTLTFSSLLANRKPVAPIQFPEEAITVG